MELSSNLGTLTAYRANSRSEMWFHRIPLIASLQGKSGQIQHLEGTVKRAKATGPKESDGQSLLDDSLTLDYFSLILEPILD